MIQQWVAIYFVMLGRRNGPSTCSTWQRLCASH